MNDNTEQPVDTLGVTERPSPPKESWRTTLLWYLLAVAICVAITVYTFRLWRADFRVLLAYGGDGFQHTVWIKNLIETGWFSSNDRFGAPGGQDLREFPQADALHYVLIYPLTKLTHDACLIVNFYYLISFPLTVIAGLFVLRKLGISAGVAVVVANLFTFMPFHFFRMGHLFFATYYLLPLAILLPIRVYQGFSPFANAAEPRAWTRTDAIVSVLLCVAIGAGGIYYAAFTCFFLLIAAIAGAGLHRSRLPLVAGGGLIACTFVGIVLALWPALEFKLSAPVNPDAIKRMPAHSEVHGLKITQLVLPVSDHRVAALRKIKERYNNPGTPLVNENDTASLGILGTIGFVYLLGRLLYRRPGSSNSTLDILSLLVAFTLLLGTIGGFGAVASYLISPWIRCYNRISICIGFFSLTALAFLLDDLRSRMNNRWGKTVFGLGLLLLMLAGVREQTPKGIVPNHEGLKREHEFDKSFIEEVEGKVPAGGMVYMLPYRPYPEAAGESQPVPFSHYDLLRPLVHSKSLRWSFGGLRGQEGDTWVKRLETMSLKNRLEELAYAEFVGVYLDRNAYMDRGAELEKVLREVLGPPLVVSGHQRYFYFDLRPYTEALQKHFSPEGWQDRHQRALKPVLGYWRKGFWIEEEYVNLGLGRTSDSRSEMELHNPLGFPRRVRLHMEFDLLSRPEPAVLTIDSPLLQKSVPIQGGKDTVIDEVIEVPPGRHTLHFAVDALPTNPNGDILDRRVAFRVYRFRCEEIDLPKASR